MSEIQPATERALSKIYEVCQVVQIQYKSGIEREHMLRMASAYIKKKYNPDVPGINKKMTYPGVSDARIILSAYDNAMPIVTYNLKDFFIYACMDQELYNSATDQLVTVESELLAMIKIDPIIQTLYKGLRL